jgi:predicted dehydrogenase
MWGSTQVKSTGPPKQLWVSVPNGESQDEVPAFVDCIDNGVESEMNAEMAAQSVAVITAAFQSAASGKVVRIG